MTCDNRGAIAAVNKPTIKLAVCAALFRLGLGAEPVAAMPVSILAAMSGELSPDVQRVGSDCEPYRCEPTPHSYGGGYSVPTYGYAYGPEINLAYLAAPVLGCPILSFDGYWRERTKRRPIAIVKGNRILIR
jgi:hypothetical protein